VEIAIAATSWRFREQVCKVRMPGRSIPRKIAPWNLCLWLDCSAAWNFRSADGIRIVEIVRRCGRKNTFPAMIGKMGEGQLSAKRCKQKSTGDGDVFGRSRPTDRADLRRCARRRVVL
jgi:hypothetical protein